MSAVVHALAEDIRHGRLAAVKRTLARRPDAARSAALPGRATPLHVAAEAGSQPVLRALLAYGADCGAANAAGELPLMLAARQVWMGGRL